MLTLALVSGAILITPVADTIGRKRTSLALASYQVFAFVYFILAAQYQELINLKVILVLILTTASVSMGRFLITLIYACELTIKSMVRYIMAAALGSISLRFIAISFLTDQKNLREYSMMFLAV